jgi:mannobiose 2-epimerase
VELGWLLRHSIRVLGLEEADYLPTLASLYSHCVAQGIDWRKGRKGGGVYCEGPHAADSPTGARERNKEFWQQAEALVAMLDAVEVFGAGGEKGAASAGFKEGSRRFAAAFFNVHRFTMDRVINHEVGEWLPLLSEDNQVVWRYLGHAWKINYHTVRAALECEKRLAALVGE